MKSLKNYQIYQQNVLLRVDINVPVTDGIVTDTSRISLIKSTVNELCDKKNKVFLLCHFGRPKGKINKNYSLRFLIKILANILKKEKIFFSSSCIGDGIKSQKQLMKQGDVCLLENVRFYEGEEKNDFNFSKLLASEFDVYVNDAFSVSHRNHASITGITKYLPSIAGNNLINEIKNLNKFLDNPVKPKTAIIGGSKVSTKLKVLNNLVEIFDNTIIGGAMANTFLYSQGFKIGKSKIEEDLIIDSKRILEKASNFENKIILPLDLVCSKNIKNTQDIKIMDIKNVLADQIAFDVGDKTIKKIRSILLKSKMILWNGPLGAFEYKPFDYGTNEINEIFIKI